MDLVVGCAALLADIVLRSYEADFIHGLLKQAENTPDTTV